MRKWTAGADPITYCPGGKSGLHFGLTVERLESANPRGRGLVCSNMIRLRMSSQLGAGVPSSASRIRWRVRSAKVCLRISSTLGGRAISSNCPPGVLIRTIRPRCSAPDSRRGGTRRPRVGRGRRLLCLITVELRRWGSWDNSSPCRRSILRFSNSLSLCL